MQGAEESLLYCCRHSVRTLDVRTNEIGLASPKFNFEPRSLTSARGYTIAGAENGYIAVLNSRTHSKTEVDIGGSLVNGIHIYQGQDSEDRALISNNDYSLKFFNLSTMRAEAPIHCPSAMNYASVSADGKMLAAVGDSTELYLFVQESGRWKRHAEICVAEDACFSSSFSPSGTNLAIGSQDGTCSILDTRMISNNLKEASTCYGPPSTEDSGALLHRVTSARHFPHGSVRSISWSPSPLDMLVFTESTSFATLLDCRDFEKQQRLRIPDGDGSDFGIGGRDREISGACWSRNGSHVYVGSEHGITEWQVKTRERRSFPSFKER